MQHQVTAGFGWSQGVEDLTRKSNGWGDISNVTVSGQPRIRGNYYPEQPTQLVEGPLVLAVLPGRHHGEQRA